MKNPWLYALSMPLLIVLDVYLLWKCFVLMGQVGDISGLVSCFGIALLGIANGYLVYWTHKKFRWW